MPSELTTIQGPRHVDAPASGELDAARRLAGILHRSVGLSRAQRRDYASMRTDDMEELCQLLHDSIRTAEQLGSQ